MEKTNIPNPVVRDRCPVCAGMNISFSHRAHDYTVSGEDFDIWACADCGLRFTQGVPEEEDIGRYYQSETYISHSNSRKGIINQVYQLVRRYMLGTKRRLIESLSRMEQGSLLDIGCGTGEFAAAMKDSGWEVVGLEPDEGARRQAREQLGIDARTPEALFKMEADSFDVITLWHVLEHIHRLRAYLQTIHQCLRSDGLLLIAVPNHLALDAMHYGADWAAWDVPRHLYHFRPEAMTRLLEAEGFRIEELRAMPFDAFYVSLLSEKYRHGHMRPFAAFATGLRSWFRARNEPACSSAVLYVVRKGES
jgi:2-polyprenyl-3-methyl-5-hydroxy-6-metoxy-1,4-benzoquinol methylase